MKLSEHIGEQLDLMNVLPDLDDDNIYHGVIKLGRGLKAKLQFTVNADSIEVWIHWPLRERYAPYREHYVLDGNKWNLIPFAIALAKR